MFTRYGNVKLLDAATICCSDNDHKRYLDRAQQDRPHSVDELYSWFTLAALRDKGAQLKWGVLLGNEDGEFFHLGW